MFWVNKINIQLAHKLKEGMPRILHAASNVLGGGLYAVAVKGAIRKSIGETVKPGAKQLLKNASKQWVTKLKN